MKMPILFRYFLFCLLCNAMVGSMIEINGQEKGTARVSEFRYIIYSNAVYDLDKPVLARRVVNVLMDEKAFSEETLKKLFNLISRRFPEPEWLDVSVATSLEQIETPEEEGHPKPSGAEGNPNIYKHHRAVFIRKDGNELIRYSISPPDPILKTVVLKGKDVVGPHNKK